MILALLEATRRNRKHEPPTSEGNPRYFYLYLQVVVFQRPISNLKFLISNAFSCGFQPPNENARVSSDSKTFLNVIFLRDYGALAFSRLWPGLSRMPEATARFSNSGSMHGRTEG
ncbi:MAG: hypothetical protein ACLFS4_04495, partial [Opitutales bacterium]